MFKSDFDGSPTRNGSHFSSTLDEGAQAAIVQVRQPAP